MSYLPEYKRPAFLGEVEKEEEPEWIDPIAPVKPPLRHDYRPISERSVRRQASAGEGPYGWYGRPWLVDSIREFDGHDYEEAAAELERRERERLEALLAEVDRTPAPCDACPYKQTCAKEVMACRTYYEFVLDGGRYECTEGEKPSHWYTLHVETDKPERPLAYREAYEDGVRSWLRKRPVSRAWWTEAVPEAAIWWRAGVADANRYKPASLAEWRAFIKARHFRRKRKKDAV